MKAVLDSKAIYGRIKNMKRTTLKLTLTFILAVCVFAGCGKDNSEHKVNYKENSTAATTALDASENISTTTAETSENTEAVTTQSEASNDVTSYDYSAADLAGEWMQKDIGNILTVNDDGTFSLQYRNGGTRFGTVKIDAEDKTDGTKTCFYSFYESDNTLWAQFACSEKPFDEISSENEGGMTFSRNTTGKYLAPSIPEAKDVRDTLAFADRLMSGGGVDTDTASEYTTDDGTVYHKSASGFYKTTDSVRQYLREHMTEQFLSSEYASLFGTEHPKCIDVDGELYIEYRPIGGRYSFTDEDPAVDASAANDSGYSIKIKNNDYGAEDTVVVEVVKEDGKWKISDVADSF